MRYRFASCDVYRASIECLSQSHNFKYNRTTVVKTRVRIVQFELQMRAFISDRISFVLCAATPLPFSGSGSGWKMWKRIPHVMMNLSCGEHLITHVNVVYAYDSLCGLYATGCRERSVLRNSPWKFVGVNWESASCLRRVFCGYWARGPGYCFLNQAVKSQRC